MWPLDPEHERLVRELGALIAKAGAWRFMRGHIAAANKRDYPDPWEETREGVARALARTVWHARLDLEVTLEDVRQPGEKIGGRLRKTNVELVRVDATRAELALSAVGNDDVAGILATEVGRAFVGQLAHRGHPLRGGASAEGVPDLASATLGAVYLGLGVVATNASRYARAVGEIVGRTAIHEHEIDQIGGLDPDDLAFLLAVQATVRDDVVTALDTLARAHAEAVTQWRNVLDDHESELLELLDLEDVDLDATTTPPRPETPRPVQIKAAWAEADLDKHNHGLRVYRYPETQAWTTTPLASLAGVVVGIPFVMAGAIMPIIIAPSVGFVGGLVYGLRRKQLRCTACGCFLTATDTACRLCGGTIAGDVKSVDEAMDREEALEAESDGSDRDDAGEGDDADVRR